MPDPTGREATGAGSRKTPGKLPVVTGRQAVEALAEHLAETDVPSVDRPCSACGAPIGPCYDGACCTACAENGLHPLADPAGRQTTRLWLRRLRWWFGRLDGGWPR